RGSRKKTTGGRRLPDARSPESKYSSSDTTVTVCALKLWGVDLGCVEDVATCNAGVVVEERAWRADVLAFR
ncbi:MAG: hypothetical protein ACREJX_00565, partial [Polyangiaceae bacterium]